MVETPVSLRTTDIQPAVDWYRGNKSILLGRLPPAFGELGHFTLENPPDIIEPRYMALSEGEIYSIIGLFPPAAVDRLDKNVTAIIGKPTTLKSTAIVSSYIDDIYWRTTGVVTNRTICLCSIPDDITADPEIKKIIHAKDLIRELSRTLITNALYGDGYTLYLPSGREVKGDKFLLEFALAAQNHPPISNYSHLSRNGNNEIKSKTQVEAEFAETIAALLLGFTFCEEEDRRLNPLSDRPEVSAITQDFLNAELV